MRVYMKDFLQIKKAVQFLFNTGLMHPGRWKEDDDAGREAGKGESDAAWMEMMGRD